MGNSVLKRSIMKKQIVAISGLLLIGFLFAHLAGNMLLFGPPEGINEYAQKLQELGPILWLFRIGLALTFAVHISFTLWVALENRAARSGRYAVSNDRGGTDFATKTMVYSGLLIAVYLLLHLSDFAFGDHYGEATIVAGAETEESLGLYGLIWNSFIQPWRVVVYVFAVGVVGLHVSHGLQSFIQTLGFANDDVLPVLKTVSRIVGLLIALGYAAIPIYMIVRHYTIGIGA